MIYEDLEAFKQDLRNQEKKDKTIAQYSNYICEFIEATRHPSKRRYNKRASNWLQSQVDATAQRQLKQHQYKDFNFK